MSHKLRLLVCRHFEAEFRAALQAERLAEVEVSAFSGQCGRGKRGWDILAKPVQAALAAGEEVHLMGSGCLKPLGSLPPEYHAVRSHQPGLCFEWVAGPALLAPILRAGGYLITPGWLAHWREWLAEAGFDQATARACFAESAKKLVLLDTGVDARSAERLQEFAAYLAQPFEVVPVGLDYLRMTLARLVLEARGAAAQAAAAEALKDANRRLGDYAMASDLVARLAGMQTEAEVIAGILELATMLFAPSELAYVPFVDGQPGPPRLQPPGLAWDAAWLAHWPGGHQGSAALEFEGGFALRIGGAGEPVGILRVSGLAFPQYQRHYQNLALNLTGVCGLAVRNARAYEKLRRNVGELQDAMANIKTLSGLLPICAACKRIRNEAGYWSQVESYIMKHTDAVFSHGLCPQCIPKYFPDLPGEDPFTSGS